MTPQTLERIAIALHGPHWKRATGKDLGVSARTLGYYMAGRDIPPDMAERLAKLLAAKSTMLAGLALHLREGKN